MSVIICLLTVRLVPFQLASLTMTDPRPALMAPRYGPTPTFIMVAMSMRMSPRSTTPPLFDVPGVAWPSPAQCLLHPTRKGVPEPSPVGPWRPIVAAATNMSATVGSSLKLS